MHFKLRHSVALAALACAGFGFVASADAKTFKWANSGDVSSMDPYARQETFLLTFTANIYDPLVRRDKDLKLFDDLAADVIGESAICERYISAGFEDDDVGLCIQSPESGSSGGAPSDAPDDYVGFCDHVDYHNIPLGVY